MGEAAERQMSDVDVAYIAGLEAAKEASQHCVHAIQCILEIQKLINARKGESEQRHYQVS